MTHTRKSGIPYKLLQIEGSRHLLANNGTLETITVKFEYCSKIRLQNNNMHRI